MKTQKVRIALAQINCTVGDLEGNCAKILEYAQRAQSFSADIICFPELAATGYPPEDLLLKPAFIEDNLKALESLAKKIDDIITVVGFVDKKGKDIFNAAAVICKGKVQKIYHKMLLPNYGVFDEKRYFTAGKGPLVIQAAGARFAVSICEDIWHEQGPTATQARLGARLILNINASPYHTGKGKEREVIVRQQARKHKVCIAYTNLVGGQDELVFDGQSMVIDKNGAVISRVAAFEEDLLITDVEVPVTKRPIKAAFTIQGKSFKKGLSTLKKEGLNSLEQKAEVYKALVLGVRDYVKKNGFSKVILGLSGGVDSSLVAAIAVDALGKENVIGIFMPSRYTCEESRVDAAQLAANLGIKMITVPIEQIYKVFLLVLEPHFVGSQRDITEENLQARIRGNILMAFSNKFGWLVLTTGNKSEMSTGYATLYGDMAGGFAVIKDVPKTLVYKLARYRNSLSFIIPERVLTKEPTAELKPNQMDRDTLPAYEELDPVLKAYIEEDKNRKKIISLGFAEDVVTRVVTMVDRNEYKRRQSPPGIKITPKAFGRDRRMPITNKYRG